MLSLPVQPAPASFAAIFDADTRAAIAGWTGRESIADGTR